MIKTWIEPYVNKFVSFDTTLYSIEMAAKDKNNNNVAAAVAVE